MAQANQQTLMKATEKLITEAATDSVDMLKQIGIKPEAYKRVILNAINSSPKLLDCNPGTIRRSILKCAQLGLLPDGDQASIVPYKMRGQLVAQVITGYKGMCDLARQAIPGISITLRSVTTDDEWEHEEGLNPVLRHVPSEDGERCTEKNFRCAYAIAWMPGNPKPEWVVLYKKEIEYIRKTYASSSSPAWIKEYAEQAKKTAGRRLGKLLPIRSGLLMKGRDIGDDAFDETWDPEEGKTETGATDAKPAGSGSARRGRPRKEPAPQTQAERGVEEADAIEGRAEVTSDAGPPTHEPEQTSFAPDEGDVDF